MAAVAPFEAIFVHGAKIALDIKELARSGQVDRLHASFRNLALIATESALIADIFPGLLIEQIHL